jgi:hypothetical protein
MMRAIVATASIGYAPTLVSPESITASGAVQDGVRDVAGLGRVGREAPIMDSSIWVATMTGLDFSRRPARPASAPAGPSRAASRRRGRRARTITPSKASTISSRFSTACGFSSLASTGSRTPTSSMIRCTGSMSRRERTNDSAIMSARRVRAKRRSASSFSVSAGTLTATPGSDRPLLFETGPPSVTSSRTSGPVDRDDLEPRPGRRRRAAGRPGETSRPGPVGGRDAVVVAGHVVGGDGDGLAGGPDDRPGREGAEADLRTLQVDQDADPAAGLVRGLADPAVGLLVLGVRAVAEVQPGDVHARVDEAADPFVGAGSRAKGADDLRAALHHDRLGATGW